MSLYLDFLEYDPWEEYDSFNASYDFYCEQDLSYVIGVCEEMINDKDYTDDEFSDAIRNIITIYKDRKSITEKQKNFICKHLAAREA